MILATSKVDGSEARDSYPNLFLLGAPKCGTTSLFDWLGQHPCVFCPTVKEPHALLDSSLLAPGSVRLITMDAYQRLYRDSGSQSIRVDGSTSYLLHSKTVIPRIHLFSPDAKFIVCLRNPVEMAVSLHAERLYQGEEDVTDFAEAWRLDPQRRRGEKLPSTAISPAHSCYRFACELGRQVQTLLDMIPANRLRLIFLEDMRENPDAEYRATLRFLELPERPLVGYRRLNARKVIRSTRLAQILVRARKLKQHIGIRRSFGFLNAVHRFNRKAPASAATVSSHLRLEMHEAFAADRALLSEITGRDLDSLWSRPIAEDVGADVSER